MFIQNYSRGKERRISGSNQPICVAVMAELKHLALLRCAAARQGRRNVAIAYCLIGAFAMGGCALDATAPASGESLDASRADQRTTSEQRSPRHSDRRHLVRVVLSLPSGERATFADVTLRIEQSSDAILEMRAPGDEVWIGLLPGRYGVRARYRDKQSITRELIVPGAGGGEVYIRWPD